MANRILDRIQALDPVRDHREIMLLSTCYEFSFDTTRALEFALFRTFAVPSSARLLDRTGEFRRRPPKRYDDTSIIVSEMMEWGYDSRRGAAAHRNAPSQLQRALSDGTGRPALHAGGTPRRFLRGRKEKLTVN